MNLDARLYTVLTTTEIIPLNDDNSEKKQEDKKVYFADKVLSYTYTYTCKKGCFMGLVGYLKKTFM